MPTAPTSAQKSKLVKLLAHYMLVDGAPIKTQQRAYDTFLSYFETLEVRYPRVAFRSEETQKSLVARAKTVANAKLFRGAGCSY